MPDLDDELTNRPTPTDADFQRSMAEVRAAVDHAAQVHELLARVANLEARVEAAQNGLGYQRSSFAQNVFIARVDADAAWTEQAPTGTGTSVTLVDFADGRSGSNKALIPIEQAGGTNNVQLVVQLRLGKALQFFSLSTGLRVVSLTVSTGSNGTDSTAPTYLYNVKGVTFDSGGSTTVGDLIASSLRPVFGRPKGAVTGPAAFGLAQPSNDGAWTLIYAHEVPDTGVCA